MPAVWISRANCDLAIEAAPLVPGQAGAIWGYRLYQDGRLLVHGHSLTAYLSLNDAMTAGRRAAQAALRSI